MISFTLEAAISALLLGVAAALIHMMFQLSVSVLTLLSGHSLGLKKAHLRLLHLNWSYIVGALIALFLLSIGTLALIDALNWSDVALWRVIVIITALAGGAICVAYYRKGKGTLLWIPRPLAEYLSTRAKKTKHGVEAAALGAMTVVAELPFAIAPLAIIAMLLRDQPRDFQVLWLLIYSLFVALPLFVVAVMVGSGQRLSVIQRWRETNKSFLQYGSGLGLVVIALYLIVFHLIGGAL